MKRIFAMALMAALLLALALPAFADNMLEKPRAGQIINLICEEDGDWHGDFYFSALTGLSREEDDLCLFFPGSRVRLRGFFAGAEGRRFHFLKGISIGAEELADGNLFPGEHSPVLSAETEGDEQKELALLEPESAETLIAELLYSGTTVSCGGEALWNEKRAQVTEKINAVSGGLRPDWSKTDNVKLELERTGTGELRIVSAQLTGLDGLTLSCTQADRLWLVSTTEIYPSGTGRNTLIYENSLGETLCRMSLVCNEGENGALVLSFPCPSCGEEQGTKPHFLACGHFACQLAEGEGHGVAQCAVAGHCLSDGKSESHALCRNCRKPLCTGGEHGLGICEHKHNWVVTGYTPPSAAADGESVSRCASCDAVYRQLLPRSG